MILTKRVPVSKQKNMYAVVREYTGHAERMYGQMLTKLCPNKHDEPEYVDKANYLYAVVNTESVENMPDAVLVSASDSPEVILAGYELTRTEMSKKDFNAWVDAVVAFNNEGDETPPLSKESSSE